MTIQSTPSTNSSKKGVLLHGKRAMDSDLRLLISPEEISKKIREIAALLEKAYVGKDLVIVMVLKGAICLTADLIRELDLAFDIAHVQCSSYGAKGTQRGELTVMGLERLTLEGRDVLIVDDIFDSGNTLATLTKAIQEKKAKSVKSLVLLHKNVPHITDLRPDYTLFDIEDLFVVGYGLDYKERYRGLTGVYVLENPKF